MKFYIFKDCPQIKNLINLGFLVNNTTNNYYIVTKPEEVVLYATVQCDYYNRKNHVLRIFSGVNDSGLEISIKYVYAVISLTV